MLKFKEEIQFKKTHIYLKNVMNLRAYILSPVRL